MKMNRTRVFKAFTLAEVLITLAVIGIVAAMAIPSLQSSIDDRHWKTAYRKAYSDINQFVYQAVVKGEFTPRTTQFEETVALPNFDLMMSYFNASKICTSNNNADCWDSTGERACVGCGGGTIGFPYSDSNAFIDASGRAWSQYSNRENIILVDVNGFEKPNKYGKDRWHFVYSDKDNVRIGTGLPEKVTPYILNDVMGITGWCAYPPCYFKSWLLE